MLMQKLKAKKQKTLNNLTYSIFYGFTHLCEAVFLYAYQKNGIAKFAIPFLLI